MRKIDDGDDVTTLPAHRSPNLEETEYRFHRTVGELIQDARKRANLRQTDLADPLDLNRVSIANIESGRQRCNIFYLVCIARLCGVDVTELIPPEWRNGTMRKVGGKPEGTFGVTYYASPFNGVFKPLEDEIEELKSRLTSQEMLTRHAYELRDQERQRAETAERERDDARTEVKQLREALRPFAEDFTIVGVEDWENAKKVFYGK